MIAAATSSSASTSTLSATATTATASVGAVRFLATATRLARLAFACIPATLAPIRSVSQSMLLVERLLSRREEKLLPTVHALEALIFARFHVLTLCLLGTSPAGQ
jgi:hypothetical protein